MKMGVAGFSTERLLGVQIILDQVLRGKAAPTVFRQGLLADRFDQPSPSGSAECAIKHLGSMAVLKKVADDGPSAQLPLKMKKIGNQVRPIERPGFQPDSGIFRQPRAYAPARLFPIPRSTFYYYAGNFGGLLSHCAFPLSVSRPPAQGTPEVRQ
ncbi:MAG: hypothetical protein AABZ15_03035 [Nitrospirota bacterium]